MKKIKIFVLFLCLMIVLSACMKKVANKDVVKLTYFARATTDQLVIWQKVLNNFMKENPDIRVVIENVPYSEYWSKLLTMAAAGTAPDIIFMESTRLASFVEKDNLLTIDDLVKLDKDVDLKDFYPVSLDMSTYKGKLYGLPNDLAIICMYYNKDAFDSAGVQYPKADWTWEDMIRIGKQLTIDKNKDGTPDQYGITHYSWDVAIYQSGGDVVDNVTNPKKSTFNKPEVYKALDFCRDLAFKHKIAPPPVQQQYRTVNEMFTSGYVAMTMDGHWMVPNYRKIKKFKWDVVELPKGKKKAGLAYGSCFSIPKGSKHPKEAWRLIKYLAGHEGQKVLVSDGFSVPALKSIANSDVFLTPPPDNQNAFLNMIKVGHLKPQTPHFNQLNDQWRVLLDSFWLNKVSAKQACKKIDYEVDKILK